MAGQTALWCAAAASAVLSGVAAVADRRRTNRRDLDRVGWAPWPLIQVVAMLLTVVAAVLAMRG